MSAKSKPLRSANQTNYKAQVLPFLSLLTGVIRKRLIVEYLSSLRHFVKNRENREAWGEFINPRENDPNKMAEGKI